MNKRLEQIQVAEEEILSNPAIEANLIIKASHLAEEDDYLYDLIMDYMKEPVGYIKDMMLDEVLNYSHELIRKQNLK